jgi:hypothetical protein
MISRQVDDFGSFQNAAGQIFNDLNVRVRPKIFNEIPHINDIAIQDYIFWIDGFNVIEKFLSMAAVCAQMDIGKYYDV